MSATTDNAELFARAERLRTEGQPGEAEALYRDILSRQPRHLAARRGLAEVLATLGRAEDAAAAQRDTQAQEAENLCKVAHVALKHGRFEAAITCFERALKLEPDSREAIWGLAGAWQGRRNLKKALGWYQRLLELNPGSPVAEHMVAALGDGPKPTRASDDYVRALFDRFAEDYDRKLLEELKYRAPQILLEAVTGVLPRSVPRLDILDLGCGTGLAGLQFRPLARRLEGVDLSPEMVAQAQARGIYDAVWAAELTAAMAAINEKFDLLVAADVVVYIGDLEPVFAAAAGALRPGGFLAFTVEWRRRPGYKLTGSGRYTHNPAYVRRCAKAAGFREVSGTEAEIRHELRKPVKGYVSVMRKA